MLNGEKRNYRIFENYRLFDKEDGFETKELCDYCSEPLEQYVVLEDYIYICKGCLNRMVINMDKEFVKFMKKAIRR